MYKVPIVSRHKVTLRFGTVIQTSEDTKRVKIPKIFERLELANWYTNSGSEMESLECTSETIQHSPLALEDSQHATDFSMLRPFLHNLSLPPALQEKKQTPLPDLDWADSSKMWDEMRLKDTYKAALVFFPACERGCSFG